MFKQSLVPPACLAQLIAKQSIIYLPREEQEKEQTFLFTALLPVDPTSHDDMAAAPTRLPPKRQDAGTADATAPKRKRTDTSDTVPVAIAAAPPERPSNKKARPSPVPHLGTRLGLGLASQDDPVAAASAAVVDSLEDRYDVQLLSVASASKIQNRVIHILQHIGSGSGDCTRRADAGAEATPPSTTTTTAGAKGKPKVSILRAKASDAGKLVTIAEIAKRELEKPGGEGAAAGEGPRWFQYTALGEEINHIPRGGAKGKGGKKDDGQAAKLRRNRGGAAAAADDEGEAEGGDGADNDDGDSDEDFETMKTPMERAIEGRPRLRGTPVMSIFLSRVSVEQLKKQYGEQTNAAPP